MRKIFLILMSLIMAMSCFAGCSTSKNDIKVKVSFTAGDEVIINREIIVDGKDATVIDAVKEAISQYNCNITINKNGYTIQSANDYKVTTIKLDGRDLTFGWLYTLNGEEVKGTADNIAIKDGDIIKYVYTYSYDDNGTYKTENYDSDMNLFGESGDEVEDTEENEVNSEETDEEE